MATGVRPARVALLGLLLGALVGCRAVAQPSASSLPPSGPSAGATPTSAPSETPPMATPTGTGLHWTEAALFGEGRTAEYAHAVTRGAIGFVAVGTRFERGPTIDDIQPPHDGRIWVSSDGRSWADVTPPGTFGNAVLDHVFTTADGLFIAIGQIADPAPDPIEDFGPSAAWESADGLSWRRVESGLPAGMTVQHLEHGPRGYLASLSAATGPQLWLSADGRSWEQVYQGAANEYLADIGAGDQGFVAVGVRVDFSEDTSEYIAVASSDGRTWIESSRPPIANYVAPLGPDWIAIALGYGQDSSDTDTPIWFSANGLNWSAMGRVPLKAVQVDSIGTICVEFAGGLVTANGWLIASLTLSGPCSEGASVSYSRALISEQGTAWQPLPFGKAPSGERGWTVLAATGIERGLLLVGFSNGRAAFWLGELP